MNGIQIRADRQKYMAQLSAAKREVEKLTAVIAALDALMPSDPSEQEVLPLTGEPVKITPGFLEAVRSHAKGGITRRELREELAKKGYPSKDPRFALKLGKVIQRQLKRGSIRTAQNPEGKMIFFPSP